MVQNNIVDDKPLLNCDDVGMSFGEKVALDGVSFSVKPGEKIALLGPNGAGKSTLIETLCGLWMPTTGAVSFMGQGRQVIHTI
ncbi:ATP-binding cassette domain-containing protein [Corynebacterium freiburgense]|uniref:ATP-binding cassette domain-containing protein n=1 Tax=Corynebacterium freiburgense TaxID=556548 RepID=UPI00047D0A01|nr:ATP-binding cassette domain-containing protein [Corynebacterium freiburgense]WJZ02830.1 Zinc import ATP-binding protein ZnuC [Corynebacterium freiburgense]